MTPWRRVLALVTLFVVAMLMFLLLLAATAGGGIGPVRLLVWFVLLLGAEMGVMYGLGRFFARRDRARSARRAEPAGDEPT